MPTTLKLCIMALLSFTTSFVAHADDELRDTVVEFRGRQISLISFLDAFPYDQWRWEGSLKHNVLYLMKKDSDKSSICKVTLGTPSTPAVLEDATTTTEENFATSLTFDWKVNEADGSLFFTKDQNNDESFNLHVIAADGSLKKLTNVNYVAGYGFSPDGKQLAYSERTGPEGARFRIHIIDLATYNDRVIASDSDAQQFTWYDMSWRPDAKGIALTTLSDGDRTRGNISYVSVDGDETQKPRLITDSSIKRTFPQATKHWISNEEVLVLSNEAGSNNLFSLNIETSKYRQVTSFGSDVDAVYLLEGTSDVVLSVKNPLATAIYRIDASKTHGEPSLLLLRPSDLNILDVSDDGEVLYQEKSGTVPFRVASFVPTSQGEAELRTRVVMAPSLIEKIVHCTVEPVMFDTFDAIPMTLGDKTSKGKIHGFLYSPRHPLPDGEQLVVVEAFYGGANAFNIHTQILCAAGIYVFSPAPRGVANVSADFELRNDGDLGGYEVLDVMHAGRFISERLGIPSKCIGVFGHSHGGYETMRHMTFPEAVGEVHYRFPWGFGIAESGFASIKGQYENSNIKEWISKEAGNPESPGVLEQWEERSPINHAERLMGNLLLIHGTNDKRVPYTESKSLYDKLVSLGKQSQVTLVPLKGVGHVAVAQPDVLARYSAWFAFLDQQR
jgi:dipeptidyl aminopeptidase/acylaminoacyl peptidase